VIKNALTLAGDKTPAHVKAIAIIGIVGHVKE